MQKTYIQSYFFAYNHVFTYNHIFCKLLYKLNFPIMKSLGKSSENYTLVYHLTKNFLF